MTVPATMRSRPVRGMALIRRAALLLLGLMVMVASSQAADLQSRSSADLRACLGSAYGSAAAGELADGRALLVIDRTLALLSADRRELRQVDWPASAGTPIDIVRLPGRGLLVGASHGLQLLSDAGRWHDVGDCARTGAIDGVFWNTKGQALLSAERGVFELTADARLRPLTGLHPQGLLALPDGRWLAEAGGALYGLNHGGGLVPLLTGVKASRTAGGEAAGWRLRELSASGWIRLGGGWLAGRPSQDAPLFVGPDGRVERLHAPDGRALPERSALMPLADGRLFLLLESGLHTWERAGGWRRVSTDVRWTSRCPAALVPLGRGRTLAQFGRQVFVITADDKAVLLHTHDGTGCSVSGARAVATGDGGAWLVADRLFHLGPDDRLTPVALPDGVAPIGVTRVGRTHVMVLAGRQLFRIDPRGRPVPLAYGEDLADADDRLYVCAAASRELQQWVDGSQLEPVAAAAGRACLSIDALQDGSMVATFQDDGPALRIDRSGVASPLSGRRFKLGDGDLFLDRSARSTFIHRSGQTSEIQAPPWLASRSPPRPSALDDNVRLHFLDAGRGFGLTGIGATSVLAITADGGRTWQPVRMGGGTIEGLTALSFAADQRHGMAVGSRGRVWATADGGASWERRPDLGEDDLMAVWLPGGPDQAFVLAPAGRGLLQSRDGGRTWTPVPGPPAAGAAALGGSGANPGRWPAFSDQGRRLWWTAEEGDVMSSTDEGRNWSLQWRYRRADRVLGGSAGMNFIAGVTLFGEAGGPACVASHAGLFCSEPGKAVMVRRSDVDMAFTDLTQAGDGLHGWAVGADGLIVATVDGGAHWAAQVSGTDKLLQGVFFLPDAVHGWAWGDGVLLSTRDGGQNWERVQPRMLD